MYQVNNLGFAEAQIAINAIINESEKRGKPVVIAIADAQGELISLLRLDNVKPSAILIAINKAFTAARERRPTYEIGLRSRNTETAFDISYYGDNRYVGWGGGIPVFVNHFVVGSVAVSGLLQQEDMELAQIGVDEIDKYLSSSQEIN